MSPGAAYTSYRPHSRLSICDSSRALLIYCMLISDLSSERCCNTRRGCHCTALGGWWGGRWIYWSHTRRSAAPNVPEDIHGEIEARDEHDAQRSMHDLVSHELARRPRTGAVDVRLEAGGRCVSDERVDDVAISDHRLAYRERRRANHTRRRRCGRLIHGRPASPTRLVVVVYDTVDCTTARGGALSSLCP